MMKGKTTIVIAHRLSTLSEMDKILVFDNGQIEDREAFLKAMLRSQSLHQPWVTPPRTILMRAMP